MVANNFVGISLDRETIIMMFKTHKHYNNNINTPQEHMNTVS